MKVLAGMPRRYARALMVSALGVVAAVVVGYLALPWTPRAVLHTTDAAYRVETGAVAPDGAEAPGPAITVWLAVPDRPAATLLARMNAALSPVLRMVEDEAPKRFSQVRFWLTLDNDGGRPWTKLTFDTAVLGRVDMAALPSPLLNLGRAAPTPTGLARLADGCTLATAALQYRSFCLRAAAVDVLPPGTPPPGVPMQSPR